MHIVKQAIAYYKTLKLEEKQRKALITSNTDFELLEKLIQKCNQNQNLRVEIFLADGSKVLIKTYDSSSGIKDIYDDSAIIVS